MSRPDSVVRPQFRVPEREKELTWWQERKKVLLPLIEQGLTSDQISELLPISASQVRSNYQRLYNELGLPKGERNSVTLIRAIYARGWLPCPCDCSNNVGENRATTEENGQVGEPAL